MDLKTILASALLAAVVSGTTQLYDRRRDELSLDEVERMVI